MSGVISPANNLSLAASRQIESRNCGNFDVYCGGLFKKIKYGYITVKYSTSEGGKDIATIIGRELRIPKKPPSF